MAKKDKLLQSTISKATSYEEMGEYWDNHSTSDYLSEDNEVHIEVRAKRRHRIVLDPTIYDAVALEARHRGLEPETLINLWVSEKLKASA